MTDPREPVNLDKQSVSTADATDEQEFQNRREFLIGLGKWSRAVIVGAIASGTLLTERSTQAASWLNRRGGVGTGWVNGGGGGWANRRGGFGGSWVNRR